MPTTAEFEELIRKIWSNALAQRAGFVDIRAGDLHTSLGGYPGPSHQMPSCCQAMRKLMQPGDTILHQPPSGKGANLQIRYLVPRGSQEIEDDEPRATFDGRGFQQRARLVLTRMTGINFDEEVPLPIGVPPQNHRFDLVSPDRRCVGECKCYSFTKQDNVPSAKLSTLLEAVFFLSFLPPENLKFVILDQRVRSSGGETLATYFVRRFHHLLRDISILELDAHQNIHVLRKGSFVLRNE